MSYVDSHLTERTLLSTLVVNKMYMSYVDIATRSSCCIHITCRSTFCMTYKLYASFAIKIQHQQHYPWPVVPSTMVQNHCMSYHLRWRGLRVTFNGVLPRQYSITVLQISYLTLLSRSSQRECFVCCGYLWPPH